MANVLPSGLQSTDADRVVEECIIVFPSSDDGQMDLSEIHIVTVHNPIDHYCSTGLISDTFKDGVESLVYHLNEARVVAKSFSLCKDTDPKKLSDDLSVNLKSGAYASLDLFNMSKQQEDVEDVPTSDVPIMLEPRKDISSVIDLHCACGTLKESHLDLIDHIKRRHPSNNWNCLYLACEATCSTSKVLKSHVKKQHFHEYKHYCVECDFGRDSVHLVKQHMAERHGYSKIFVCTKKNCEKKLQAKHI